MYLLDTNIFLEILLNQEKSTTCKNFLLSANGKIYISDFSLHSIGVILFRYKRVDAFISFIEDVLSQVHILNLPSSEYLMLTSSADSLNLDFDDLYQYQIAKYFNLNIVTMDQDFKKVKDLEITFL